VKKSIYSRVDEDLYVKVQEYSRVSIQTLSAAVENLLVQGLSATNDKALVDRLEKELAILKQENQKFQHEKGDILAKLQVCQKNESLALTARNQAVAVKTQFENILSGGVAKCGQQGCGQIWRLYDVWHHQCPKCGSTAAKLLDHYTPPLTTGENIRDVLAVVGGAAALVGLLSAISGSDKSV
jgi:hypothetical protein